MNSCVLPRFIFISSTIFYVVTIVRFQVQLWISTHFLGGIIHETHRWSSGELKQACNSQDFQTRFLYAFQPTYISFLYCSKRFDMRYRLLCRGNWFLNDSIQYKDIVVTLLRYLLKAWTEVFQLTTCGPVKKDLVIPIHLARLSEKAIGSFSLESRAQGRQRGARFLFYIPAYINY